MAMLAVRAWAEAGGVMERAHTSCAFCGQSVHATLWLAPLPDGRLICCECTGLMVAHVERAIAPAIISNPNLTRMAA